MKSLEQEVTAVYPKIFRFIETLYWDAEGQKFETFRSSTPYGAATENDQEGQYWVILKPGSTAQDYEAINVRLRPTQIHYRKRRTVVPNDHSYDIGKIWTENDVKDFEADGYTLLCDIYQAWTTARMWGYVEMGGHNVDGIGSRLQRTLDRFQDSLLIVAGNDPNTGRWYIPQLGVEVWTSVEHDGGWTGFPDTYHVSLYGNAFNIRTLQRIIKNELPIERLTARVLRK